MNTKNIENAVSHITALQERLCHCENNLQYIKRLQALKYWLHKFESFWISQAGNIVNMQQFMRVIFIPAVDSHSTIGYVTQS